MPAKISLIVAVDHRLGIASTQKPGMLWHLKKDFQHFKQITLGHPIIMGRKTHEAIGRVLPGRDNIIITRDHEYAVPGCEVVNSLAEAIALAKTKDDTEIFIIGGGQIFQEAITKDLVDRLYVTRIEGDFNADIFFPKYDHIFTKKISEKTDEEGQDKFTFYVLEKH